LEQRVATDYNDPVTRTRAFGTTTRKLTAADKRIMDFVELTHHLRYCRECSETDVMVCEDGKPLWLKCFPADAVVENHE
jgi:hypothetical protein